MSSPVDFDATLPVRQPAGSVSRVVPPVSGSTANPDAPVPLVFGEIIARGGMGAILRAQDCKLPRIMAAKIILAGGEADETQRQRFINEAAVLAQLAHPNIVPVYDIGRDAEGNLYYTMKLVKGRTLQAILSDIRDGVKATLADYPINALLTIFLKMCDAMAFAHSKGIIHRDLKPENIMVGEFGEVLVMDWGLAKILHEPKDAPASTATILGGQNDGVAVGVGIAPDDSESQVASTSGSRLDVMRSVMSSMSTSGDLGMTSEGMVLGTPQYMSPEQAQGLPLDASSDIFSLGGILYCILTLRPPVEGKTLEEVMQKVVNGHITPPSAFGAATTGKGAPATKGAVLEAKKIKPLPHCPGGRVPPALSSVVMKALRLKREHRYPSAIELGADIKAYQNGFATRAENASLMKQLILLIQRHKGVFATAAAAWLVITALAVWFVLSIRASERETRRQAEIAQSNEKRAVASEQEAVAEKENVRRALAKSALALAEAAYREADGPAMQSALDTVPADLRDANWSYLLEQSDTSLGQIPSPGFRITSIAPHPKQPGVFAIAGATDQVVIVDARGGKQLSQFDVDLKKGTVSAVNQGIYVAFSPDGERIAVVRASSNDQGGIAIHSARDGSRLMAWDSTPANQLEFSPDGRQLLQISRGTPQHAKLWDATNGMLLWSYSKPKSVLRTVIMPDGHHVLALVAHEKPVLLKVADGTVARTFDDSVEIIDALAVSPDGLTAAWGDPNGNVVGLDLREGRLLFSTRAHSGAVLRSIFTADSQRFVSVAELPDGRQSIVISHARTGAPLQALVGGSGTARAIALHPISGELLVGGQICRIWDITGSAPRWSMPVEAAGPPPGSAAFCGSDDLFLGSVGSSRTVLQDLRDSSVIWRSASGGHRMPSATADGRFIAVAAANPSNTRVQVARHEEGKVSTMCEFDVNSGLVALRLDPSGVRLAIAARGKDKPLAILDSATGAQQIALDQTSLQSQTDLHWLDGAASLVGLAIAKKPRGVAGSEERIIVWDATTGKQLRSVVHPTALDCLVVAPDGKSFAAAGRTSWCMSSTRRRSRSGSPSAHTTGRSPRWRGIPPGPSWPPPPTTSASSSGTSTPAGGWKPCEARLTRRACSTSAPAASASPAPRMTAPCASGSRSRCKTPCSTRPPPTAGKTCSRSSRPTT